MFFFIHGHFSWSTFCLHLLKGPKVCESAFVEIGPRKCDHGKTPSKMGQLHGPSCN